MPDTGPARKLLRTFETNGWGIAWGKGKMGAALLSLPGVRVRNILNLSANGALWLNFWVLKDETDVGGPEWNALERIGRQIAGQSLPDDLKGKNPKITYETWAPHVDEILAALSNAANGRS